MERHISISLERALALNKASEAQVVYDTFIIHHEKSRLVLLRYHLHNQGLSILHAPDDVAPAFLPQLWPCEISAEERLDNMDLAYSPVASWSGTKRRHFLGS
jgi:hypothetical protein